MHIECSERHLASEIYKNFSISEVGSQIVKTRIAASQSSLGEVMNRVITEISIRSPGIVCCHISWSRPITLRPVGSKGAETWWSRRLTPDGTCSKQGQARLLLAFELLLSFEASARTDMPTWNLFQYSALYVCVTLINTSIQYCTCHVRSPPCIEYFPKSSLWFRPYW